VLRAGGTIAQSMRADLLPLLPVTLTLILAGIATVLLYSHIGLLAFTVFALVVVVPQLFLPALIAQRPVSQLDHHDAVALYAQAIADELRLGRGTRLVLKDAAQFIRERPLCPRDGRLSDPGTGHRLAIVEAVLYYREHWDGVGGKPGAVGGEMIPLESRILAVADAWSGLTAAGSPGLTHSQALNQLEARAGMHFDPRIVRAATGVVERQRLGMPAATAYQPRLHHLALPEFARSASAYLGELLTPAPVPRGLEPLPSRRLS
jgi:hypothetical protein